MARPGDINPRILIGGSAYIDSPEKRELALMWLKTVRAQNPGPVFEIVVVDSCSPIPCASFMDCKVIRFDDNVGAISRGERDGAGRALTKIWELAIAGGYEYIVHWECDFLFAPSVREVQRKMQRAAVVCAVPGFAAPYQFCEWGISFFWTRWVEEFDLIAKYDWQNAPVYPIVEIRLENIIGDDLFILPFRGRRNEDGLLNPGNLANHFPYHRPDWLHHADLPTMRQFLHLNNVRLV